MNTQTEVKPAPIQVDNEWAELKECIYGAPHDFVFSRWLSDAACRPWGEFRDFWMANQGKSLRDVDKERFDRLMSQVQGAIDFLRAQGVIVHLPVPHTERNMEFPRGENHGCLTAWMRDPFVTIDNNVIELAPRSMFHRRQRFPIRSILASTMARGARYFAQPDSGAEEDNDGLPGWGYLEGGDILTLGKKILVGHSGNCSNMEGVRWLQHMLGDGYSVEQVQVDKHFSHLDCVMLTPREGVAVVCLEGLPGGIPDYIKDWDLIDVPFDIAKPHMGCNNLTLNDHFVVVPEGEVHEPLVKALKQRRFEVARLPYEAVYWVGGSFRCAYQPLVRN